MYLQQHAGVIHSIALSVLHSMQGYLLNPGVLISLSLCMLLAVEYDTES